MLTELTEIQTETSTGTTVIALTEHQRLQISTVQSGYLAPSQTGNDVTQGREISENDILSNNGFSFFEFMKISPKTTTAPTASARTTAASQRTTNARVAFTSPRITTRSPTTTVTAATTATTTQLPITRPPTTTTTTTTTQRPFNRPPSTTTTTTTTQKPFTRLTTTARTTTTRRPGFRFPTSKLSQASTTASPGFRFTTVKTPVIQFSTTNSRGFRFPTTRATTRRIIRNRLTTQPTTRTTKPQRTTNAFFIDSSTATTSSPSQAPAIPEGRRSSAENSLAGSTTASPVATTTEHEYDREAGPAYIPVPALTSLVVDAPLPGGDSVALSLPSQTTSTSATPATPAVAPTTPQAVASASRYYRRGRLLQIIWDK
ncbi:cell wall protein DAN4-like [Penaeus monodon]|uniref:cell wall protein DAN4-like n=1 Tax=Penaeus monodon TaxID=6687 RepID=UPI0018A78983|nr:cell wall protein DAN4-like [Penaeus monodon]